tara:strand:+ start:282 stop:791 length:510 start_codon:yes stop_codon:yes gene_type:complete
MSHLFKEFQAFRKILCICPCCGTIIRVSDLHLKTKGVSAKTWLDEYENKILLVRKKEERFEEQKRRLRSLAVARGRKAATIAFNKAISPKFKSLGFDLFDIKSILNPIDFVVFDGMNEKSSVNDVVFLSKSIKNPALNSIRQQVKKAITQKKYEWQVARINEIGKIKFE